MPFAVTPDSAVDPSAFAVAIGALLASAHDAAAATYPVGSEQSFATSSQVPWELLQPETGADPLAVDALQGQMCDLPGQGTESLPIVVRGARPRRRAADHRRPCETGRGRLRDAPPTSHNGNSVNLLPALMLSCIFPVDIFLARGRCPAGDSSMLSLIQQIAG